MTKVEAGIHQEKNRIVHIFVETNYPMNLGSFLMLVHGGRLYRISI